MTRKTWRSIRLGLVALFVVSPIGVRAQAGVRYLAHPVPPPQEDRRAIPLPGKCAGADHEQWLDIEADNDPSAMSGRFMVRNVCQASLTPFLPDPKVASGAAMIVAPGGGTLLLSMDRQGYRI